MCAGPYDKDPRTTPIPETAMEKERYQLSDSLSAYDDLQGNIIVMLGRKGQMCTFQYSTGLLRILQTLMDERTFEDITKELPEFTPASLRRTISRLVHLGVVEESSSYERALRCAIIGCGSIGSHVFRQLSTLPLEKILLIDTDTVDGTNVYRQDYYPDDIGLKKTDILSKRSSLIRETSSLEQVISTKEQLISIIQKHNINLVIQAADTPSTDTLARIINAACEECNTCYIINPGYMGSAMSLPEFFFPRCTYSYISSHQTVPGRKLLQFQKSKLNYRLCSELSCLIAEQVEDYRLGRTPKHYGEKGYFDAVDFSWHTRRIITADQMELTRRKFSR